MPTCRLRSVPYVGVPAPNGFTDPVLLKVEVTRYENCTPTDRG
jgi:hypothetical protein